MRRRRSTRLDGLVVCLTGVPLAPFNATLVERLPDDPDAAIDRAEAHYAGTGLTLGIDLEPSLHGPVRAGGQRARAHDGGVTPR